MKEITKLKKENEHLRDEINALADEYNTKEGIKIMALSILRKKYGFSEEELEKVSETLYLLDIDNLINL